MLFSDDLYELFMEEFELLGIAIPDGFIDELVNGIGVSGEFSDSEANHF